jgi:hypothetical protein
MRRVVAMIKMGTIVKEDMIESFSRSSFLFFFLSILI